MAGTSTYSWGNSYSPLGNTQNSVSVHKIALVGDASNGSFPAETIPVDNISGGMIVGCRVKFGSPAPNGLVVTISDSDGIPIYVSDTLTASGAFYMESSVAYAGVLTASFSGNTTASAVATVKVLVI